MVAMSEKHISIEETAKRLGVHQNTIRNAIERGDLRAVKVFGRWRIPESEIDRVLSGEPLPEHKDKKED